ncbi:MAG: AmmeMemoRadiSam system protein B [Candidatus Calescibacterium sp.]|nr:AmmeMemoRadiSam system protein B [Candidatus Calescibacterium sp.]MCX7733423.1 AmmeMemoRadiSam system protein B [bacterium]MDW8087550.1 AmmeMemoRadiSam system protein B [Candidatus Calescibacterium sp.]
MIERKPAVAGIFYPESDEKLRSSIKSLISTEPERNVIGVILPHAGYIYSGKIAGKTVSKIRIPERAIILCPNHTGYGETISLFPPGEWKFPGFSVKIDKEITEKLASKDVFQLDTGAHLKEHSAEVIIPFLYFKNPNIKISVVCMRTLHKDTLKKVSSALAEIYKEYKDVLFVASSDMNHYEEDDISRKKDEKAIEKITQIDPDGFINVCYNMSISVCGIAPIYTLLNLLKDIGVRNSEVVAYSNSGEVNGDLVSVVGYVGIIFFF